MARAIRDPERIWIRAPNWVGDAVMATPVLRALRRAHPNAHLTVCGAVHLEPLYRKHPNVDTFVRAPGRSLGSILVEARRLRREAPDWAVLLPDSSRAAILPFLARTPVRIGYAREPFRRAMLTDALDPPTEGGRRVPISMIERYLRITRRLGCADRGLEMELPLDPLARERVETHFAGLSRRFVITPGASFGSSKLWPTRHFAAAADTLCERLEATCIIAPGPGEEAIGEDIAGRMAGPVRLWVRPGPDLAELVALIDDSLLLLTNDTGPRHIAVARGTPVVCLMGSTDPRHTHHLLERQRVLREDVPCSPCGQKVCPIDHRCMTRLLPERVVAAAEELLA